MLTRPVEPSEKSIAYTLYKIFMLEKKWIQEEANHAPSK